MSGTEVTYGVPRSDTTMVAWESGTWWWNDFAHGVGAFLTSGGAAGSAAVVAAGVAAWQVHRTREQDRQRALDDAKAKRRDQLWERVIWITENMQMDQPSEAVSVMLESLFDEASATDDEHLQRFVTAVIVPVLEQFSDPDEPPDGPP